MFLNRKQERETKLSKKSLIELEDELWSCLLYTSPSPRDPT